MQRNSPNELPIPQRAEDIVAEARRRLATGGGKASQLPAMVQKVTEEYRYKDNQQLQGRDSRNALQMPNNMEAYIDKVLGMSSLADPSKSSSPPGVDEFAQTPTAGPVPGGRDTSDLDPSDPKVVQIEEQAASEGWSFGQIAAALAGVGGLVAAGRYLMNRYGKGGQNTPVGDATNVARNVGRSAVDDTIDAVDGNKSVVPYEPGMSPEDDTPKQVEGTGKQARLEGPQKQITGPDVPVQEGQAQLPPAQGQKLLTGPRSPVDESIDATMGGADLDTMIRQRVEAGGTPGSDQARYSGTVGRQNTSGGDALDINDADARQIMMDKVQKLPPREAIKILRDAGIELDDNMLRTILENSNTVRGLKDRADSIRSSVRGVAKKAARP